MVLVSDIFKICVLLLRPPIHVDNATYGMGFHNSGAQDTSSGPLYDDLTKSVNTGEGNYFELAASGLSNTYESVTAGVYSELSSAYSTTDTQVRNNITAAVNL
jgi:hypothetical protein